MTEVRVAVSLDSASGERIAARSEYDRVIFTPSRRRIVDGVGDLKEIVLPAPVTVHLRDANPTTINLAASDGVTWFWHVTETAAGITVEYAITVPQSETPVNLADLPHLDPEAFTPIDDVTTVAETFAALQDEVDTKASTSALAAEVEAREALEVEVATKADASDLADYVPLTQKGAASGVASLGSDGKVPIGQLPADIGGIDPSELETAIAEQLAASEDVVAAAATAASTAVTLAGLSDTYIDGPEPSEAVGTLDPVAHSVQSLFGLVYALDDDYTVQNAGVLTSLSTKVVGAEAGRIVRLFVLRPVEGDTTYEVVYASPEIPAATAGTYTHTASGQFLIEQGDIPAAFTNASDINKSIYAVQSGGNAISQAIWLPSTSATYTVGTVVTGTVNADNRKPAVYAQVRTRATTVATRWADRAGGWPRLNTEGRLAESTRPASDNYWYGKSVVWLGTSVPAIEGSYVEQVASALGAEIDNQAFGSSGIVWDGTRALSLGATQAELTAAFGSQYANQSYESRVLGKNADLYVFDHGYNDRDRTIGNIGDTTAATFYGAFNVVLGALLSENPKAQIILITPHTAYAPFNETTGGTVAKTGTLAVRAALIAIGERYGLPVLDWTLNTGLVGPRTDEWLTDGVHPDSDWYAVAARKLHRFIASI